jgi:hypothetical protein
MRKLVIVLLICVLVAIAIVTIVSGVQSQRAKEANNATLTQRQTTTPAPSLPVPSTTSSVPATPTSPGGSPSTQSLAKKTATAVTAAATSLAKVQMAMFMPTAQMKRAVEQFAAPEVQTALMQSFTTNGPAVAKAMGYANASDLLSPTKGGFEVDTDKIRINHVDGQKASISVFALVHWKTPRNQDYWVPSLQIVNLRRVSGHWLYVSSQNPPSGQTPQLTKLHQTYDQIWRQYLPYLKGYLSYVPSHY